MKYIILIKRIITVYGVQQYLESDTSSHMLMNDKSLLQAYILNNALP